MQTISWFWILILPGKITFLFARLSCVNASFYLRHFSRKPRYYSVVPGDGETVFEEPFANKSAFSVCVCCGNLHLFNHSGKVF